MDQKIEHPYSLSLSVFSRCVFLRQKFDLIMAQEISLEMVCTSPDVCSRRVDTVAQVRSHLADLGYVDVPDDVLDEFREELSRRIRSKTAEDIPAPLQEKQKVSKQAQEPEIGQYADAKNMLRTRRPHTSYERQRKVEAEDRQSLHVMHYDGDGSEEEKENVVPDSGRQPKAPNELSRSVCSISSVKSCSSGVIRPSTQMYGRLQKKSDPVAGYMKMKQVSSPPPPPMSAPDPSLSAGTFRSPAHGRAEAT